MITTALSNSTDKGTVVPETYKDATHFLTIRSWKKKRVTRGHVCFSYFFLVCVCKHQNWKYANWYSTLKITKIRSLKICSMFTSWGQLKTYGIKADYMVEFKTAFFSLNKRLFNDFREKKNESSRLSPVSLSDWLHTYLSKTDLPHKN